jgi:hypothetical protein
MTLSWRSMARTNRVAIAALVVASILLVFAPQTRDMLAGLSDSFTESLAFHVALWFIAFSAWHWSRAVLSARFKIGDEPNQRARARSTTAKLPVDPVALDLVPRLLFAGAAAVGVIAGLRSEAWWQVAIIVAWAVPSLGLLKWRLSLQNNLVGKTDLTTAARRGLPPKTKQVPSFLNGPWSTITSLAYHAPFGSGFAYGFLVIAGLFFLSGVVTTFVPAIGMRFPRFIASFFTGPSAALLCFGLAMGPLTVISFWTDLYRFPGLRRPPVFAALLLVMLSVPAIFNLHRVRIVSSESGSTTIGNRATLKEAFSNWASQCVPGSGEIRPIIVAISGGASAAGLWGARILEAVEEADPGQNSGIFAVSSVSGGSFGASTYFASLAEQAGTRCRLSATSREGRRRAMARAIGRDALGPLLASALFGDIPRSLLGWIPSALAAVTRSSPSWLRGGDRAEGLERAFEANWLSAYRAEFSAEQKVFSLDEGFLSLFGQAGQLRPGPIWIANGTDAQNGGRIITSPVQFSNDCVADEAVPCGWPFHGALDALGLIGADIPTSTAIDNTDRFPFLSPEGALTPVVIGREYPMQIIDGGYFDNGGALTALELARWLEAQGSQSFGATSRRLVRPIIVQATTAFATANAVDTVSCQSAPDNPTRSRGKQNLLQFFAPIGGINAVRTGHEAVVWREIRDHYCDQRDQRFFHFYLLNNDEFTVPLNWTLSRRVVGYVWDKAIDDLNNCGEYNALKAALKSHMPRGSCKP